MKGAGGGFAMKADRHRASCAGRGEGETRARVECAGCQATEPK